MVLFSFLKVSICHRTLFLVVLYFKARATSDVPSESRLRESEGTGYVVLSYRESSIDRYFWSEHGIKGLAVMWKGHSYCRSHWESTPLYAALCSFRTLLRTLCIIVAWNKQSATSLKTIQQPVLYRTHLKYTLLCHILHASLYLFSMFLYLPFVSIYSLPLGVSLFLPVFVISSFCLRSSFTASLSPPFSFWWDAFSPVSPFSSGLQHYRLPK